MTKPEAIEKAKKVKFVVLDIHGVLTDNTLYYTQEGVKSEAFSLHDRLGFKALVDSGIGVSFLTTKVSRADEQMAKIYGIAPENLWSAGAKMARLDEFEKTTGYTDEDICYVGDEMIDLGIMKRAGFAVAARRRVSGGEVGRRLSDHCRRRQRRGKGVGPIHTRSPG